MISFTCDYNEGAHPEILGRLQETNLMQVPGYGEDEFCESAKQNIRSAAGCPDADIFFLVGGTQTNATVISSMLGGCEGAIAADTGHIGVHEAGAVEFTGHKVLTIPQKEGKIEASALLDYLQSFYADESCAHMVQPGMVYISFPTEYGTIYTKRELEDIGRVCRQYSLPLFIDGARLGYGLASRSCDLSLKELAGLCDVFYIGGTKVGALCGEAVVFPKGNAPKHFFTSVKQHGALLAKGRLLGLQFDTLFRDGLYFRISRSAVYAAERLKDVFARNGIELYIDSPTNQQFVLLDEKTRALLDGHVLYEIWGRVPDGRVIARFATSWATTDSAIDELEARLRTGAQSCRP